MSPNDELQVETRAFASARIAMLLTCQGERAVAQVLLTCQGERAGGEACTREVLISVELPSRA